MNEGDVLRSDERDALRPEEKEKSRGDVPRTSTATLPSRDELVQVWGDGLLASLPGRVRARFRVGRFVATEDGTAVFALPDETHRSYCEEVCTEVESVLAARFGTPVPLRLVVDEDPAVEPAQRTATGPRRVAVAARRANVREGARSAAPASRTSAATVGTSRRFGASGEEDDEDADSEAALFDSAVLEAETEPAGAGPSPEERIKLAFPGAEEV